MRILFVSNLYPPRTIGGYELRCHATALALSSKGHEIAVATGADGSIPDRCEERHEGISKYVCLKHYRLNGPNRASDRGCFTKVSRLWMQGRDLKRFCDIVRGFRPDLIAFWNMGGLTKAILHVPAHFGIPCVYCFGDVWIRELYGRNDADSLGWINLWRRRPPAALSFIVNRMRSIGEHWMRSRGLPTARGLLRGTAAVSASEFLRMEISRTAAITFGSHAVIYNGVQESRFYRERSWQARRGQQDPLRILCPGVIAERKSPDTLVDAVSLLPHELREKMRVQIVGNTPDHQDNSYIDRLNRMIDSYGLRTCVEIRKGIPHDDMPALYAEADVLVFTSTLPEGFGLTMVEGMLSGCCVFSTGSGGAGEIAAAADLPLFPPGNSVYLSYLLGKAIRNLDFVIDVAERGQVAARERFTFARMISEYEDLFHSVLEGGKPD